MATSFGAALRQFRLGAGLNQRELAALVGLDFSYISKLENDRLPPPAADTVVALCRALHVEPEELLALIGKLPSQMRQVVSTNKAALAFLREAQRMELTDDVWKNLTHSLQERSKMYRILITDALSPQALELLKAANDTRFDVVESPSQDKLAELVSEYDGLIIRSSVKVTKQVLENAARLKVIGRAGVGLDNVDIQAASRRGVVVMNTPAANTITTAEYAVALILSLYRHVPQAQASLVKGEWKRSKFMGSQLHGKTLGIIGLGRIGSHVAHIAQAFGMKVIGVDPYISAAVAQERKITLVSLEELLAQADVITLHSVLTAETRNMINAETIAKMKHGVRLVNAARGELIDEKALVEALQTGQIAGAALDTFAKEPLPADSQLRTLPNVVMTPHVAASTIEAQDDAGMQVVEQVLAALRGDEYRNAVNIPVKDAAVFKELQPYLNLAERMGSLQMQLAARPISQVEVEVHGDDVDEHIKPLTVAVLKGMLDSISDTPINYINALHLALERGIRVTETRGLVSSSYANQVLCRVKWENGERVVVGSLLGDEAPRVVQIDSFRLEANLEGIILVVESVDKPGVISRVSTLLAANDINIAEWRLGRTAPGAQVISFVNLDAHAPDSVLADVKNLEGVVEVKQIYL
jgi:D-3-phosphoglycerate dehydrogenase